MKAPSLTTVVNGNNKTLYMPNIPSIEQATKKNLKEKLTGNSSFVWCMAIVMNDCIIVLGIHDNHEIVVADATSPKQLIINIRLTYDMN